MRMLTREIALARARENYNNSYTYPKFYYGPTSAPSASHLESFSFLMHCGVQILMVGFPHAHMSKEATSY